MQNDMTDKQTWHAEAMRLVDELIGYSWLEGHSDGCEYFEKADKCADKRHAIHGALSAHLASMAAPGVDAEDAGADAKRLDWLQRQDLDDLAMGLVQDAPHDGEYVLNCGRGPFYGKTLRAAIDAAMAKETK